MIYITSTAEETKKVASEIAKKYTKKARIFALSGDLGTGKTTFVQGFAKALGIKEKIISPTYVLVRQHRIPRTQKTLFHINLYRLEGESILKEIGIEEIFKNPNSVVLVEWAEKLKDQLPKDTLFLYFERTDSNLRRITFNLT